MTIKTEGRHAAEFLVSEANNTRSRETGTVTSGQNLKAGEVVMLSGGKLVTHDGLLDTAGAVITPAVGVMFNNYDASPTGANADITGAVYIARDAEVNADELTYPPESTDAGEKAAQIASLALLGIIAR